MTFFAIWVGLPLLLVMIDVLGGVILVKIGAIGVFNLSPTQSHIYYNEGMVQSR